MALKKEYDGDILMNTLIYRPAKRINNIGILIDAGRHKGAVSWGGEIKRMNNNEYRYHPYGQDLSAEACRDIAELLDKLNGK